MGNLHTNSSSTLIMWFDRNVDSSENRAYREELDRHREIELKCYNSTNNLTALFKDIKFQNTIIITSGSLYKDIYEGIKKQESEINFIPKIIIFTSDARDYVNKNKNSLPLNHPFYNSGGVVDSIGDLKNYIEKSLNQKQPEFRVNRNEILKYQKITNKSELILPLYYLKYLKQVSEEDIKNFNKLILDESKGITEEEGLFSQLVASGELPLNLLIKFWYRAYSTHLSFSKNMNEKLLNGQYKDYFPFIVKSFEAVSEKISKQEYSTLYKGIIVDEYDWKIFLDNFKPGKELPSAILYGPSFFSFYKEKSIVEKFRNNNKPERKEIFLWITINNVNNNRFIKNQAIISKEFSYYKSEKEVLFFPFSSFKIDNINKKAGEDKEYEISLSYLDEYDYSFQEGEIKNFFDIPKNDYSILLFNSELINSQLIKIPTWVSPFTIFQNDEIIEVTKEIDNKILQNAVKEVCENAVKQKFNSNLEELKKIILEDLKKYLILDWYVSVSKNEMNNFGNIDQNSIMTFHHDDSNYKFYINVALKK